MSSDQALSVYSLRELLLRVLAAGRGSLSARLLADGVNDLLNTQPLPYAMLRRAEVEVLLDTDPAFLKDDEGNFGLSAAGGELAAKAYARPVRLPLDSAGSSEVELSRWQREAFARWMDAGARGIVVAVTGAGKTRIGVKAIREHLTWSDRRAVVLVPGIDLMHQWHKTLQIALDMPIARVGDGETARIEDALVSIWVARSAAESLAPQVRDLESSVATLLIADECHRFGAEGFAKALDAPYAATLGLSATPERAGDDAMERAVLPRLGPVIFEYSHADALDDEAIADFEFLFVGVAFRAGEAAEFERLEATLGRAMRSIAAKYPWIERARPLRKSVLHIADAYADADARAWLQAIDLRSTLTGGGAARLDFVKWLAEEGRLSNRRTLVFDETIASCERIAVLFQDAGLRSGVHHSRLSREGRRSVLEGFAEGKLDLIAAPRTLDEGIDVPDADLALIVAGTRVKRQTVQRMGRVLRRSPGKEVARIIKVFIRDATDDPRNAANRGLTRELAIAGKARILIWPEESDQIDTFLEQTVRA